MPRIQPVDVASATGKTAELLATTRERFGGTPNLFTTTAQSPAALEAMLGLFASLGKASLGPKIGEQIALAVAQRNECGYCLAAHSAIGGMHGLSTSTMHAARRADSTDARTAALLAFAMLVLDSRGHVDDASLIAVREAGVTDGEIVEVVAHIALNVFTNFLNSVSETDVDFPVVAVELERVAA